MPADVRAAIRDIMAAQMRSAAGGKELATEEARDSYFQRMAESKLQLMEREGRYVVEAWS
jgi:hypothetical protein